MLYCFHVYRSFHRDLTWFVVCVLQVSMIALGWLAGLSFPNPLNRMAIEGMTRVGVEYIGHYLA